MKRQKPPDRQHKQWTPSDNKLLKNLAKQDTPTPLIAWELGRTTAAVFNQASKLGVSLEPSNPRHRKAHSVSQVGAR